MSDSPTSDLNVSRIKAVVQYHSYHFKYQLSTGNSIIVTSDTGPYLSEVSEITSMLVPQQSVMQVNKQGR